MKKLHKALWKGFFIGAFLVAVVLLPIVIFFVAGCIEDTSDQGRETKYVCPNGSIVSDPSLCNAEETTTTKMTTTTIEDENILKIINNTDSLSINGNSLYINGEVENRGSCTVIFVKVNVKFYKDNQFVKQYSDNVDGIHIPSDKTKTFRIVLGVLDYDYYTLYASGECSGEIIYSEEIKIIKTP